MWVNDKLTSRQVDESELAVLTISQQTDYYHLSTRLLIYFSTKYGLFHFIGPLRGPATLFFIRRFRVAPPAVMHGWTSSRLIVTLVVHNKLSIKQSNK
jgi:hypothetical protein